jgi:hypothetical protein
MNDDQIQGKKADLVSNAVHANLAKLSSPDCHPGPSESLRSLIDMIECGIAKRGFHITNADGLQRLWGDGIVSFQEKLSRIEHFAETHEWEAASKDRLAFVLFQPVGGTKLLSGGSWLGRDK